MGSEAQPVINNLQADENPEVLEIEGLCLNCKKNGMTRLLLTRIQFFREVVLASFSCPHCGWENRSIDPAAPIAEKGQRITLEVKTERDLNRKVVQPSHSAVLLPEYDASFPTSQGVLSTVEGVLVSIISNLESAQSERKKIQPDVASKIDDFLEKLRSLLTMKESFTIVLDDPSGNGFIENLLAPDADPQLEIITYERSDEQNISLGIKASTPVENLDTVYEENECATETDVESGKPLGTDEVVSFQVNCPSCNASTVTNMKLVDIPHFKEVILMAINCSWCGFKDNEVRSGGTVAPKGRCYKLRITNVHDLSRDVLLSDTALVKIPELEFESSGGTMGGRFTTLEGLLNAFKDKLVSANPFVAGDSVTPEEKTGKLASLIKKLEQVASGETTNVMFELIDPAGGSYLQNLYAPDSDPEMEVIDYERSKEEIELLGLDQMKTENY